MKLAVSNLAWSDYDTPEVLELLRAQRVTGIEMAPTKVWPDWAGATTVAAANYRRKLADAGFVVPSLQAVLFGQPNARLFDSEGRARFVAHLRNVAALAQALGAAVVVLGAPKQRDPHGLPPREAFDQAVAVFQGLGRTFSDHGTCLCIEPNPRRYGCAFIVNTREGLELVHAVASPGFALHLDAAAMYLEGDSLEAAWEEVGPALRHFHVSEPDLGDFSKPVVDHASNLRVLKAGGYLGWVSLELNEPQNGPAGLLRAISYTRHAAGEA